LVAVMFDRVRRSTVALVALAFLSGCVAQLPWASDERLASAVYTHAGTKSVTLMTVIANDNGSAGHSALLINASQRVIYDPAGTWSNRRVPERADMLYGITPTMLQYYLDYHARKRFHVVMQTKTLSAEAAETLFRIAIENGASMAGMCANNTSHILSRTPGFAGFPVGLWPKDAVAAFAELPGVTTKRIYQDDEGKDLKS